MSSKPIERITMPTRDVFFQEYVIPRRPVIITDLFAGQAIEKINTLQAAREEFGHVQLEVQPEYSTRAANASTDAARTMTVDDYLDFIAANPSTRLMCTEYATPARVSAQYRLPDLCKTPEASLAKSEVLGMPRRWGDHDLLANTFLGNQGNYAHTHYDGDHRQVILYQIFGKKRVILFQPASGKKLNVLDAFMQGFCNTYLQDMSDEQRSEFVEQAGGYEAILEPGEAVYMPMLIWHYLEYIDTGMSINFRFGRNRYGRFLCIDNFHRDYYVQNVSAKMVDEARVEREYSDAIEEIKAEYVRPCSNRSEKVRSMRALFKKICSRVSPEAESELHCPPEREAQQLAQIEAELASSMRYTDAALHTVGPPAEPINAAQTRAITSRVRACAYPPGVFERLVYNRFGKDLQSLSRTEAALLLRSLASPGANW